MGWRRRQKLCQRHHVHAGTETHHTIWWESPLCGGARAVQSEEVSETLEWAQLRQLQLHRVQALLAEILPRNAFYQRKLGGQKATTWDEFQQLPVTTKTEIADDQALNSP